MGKQNPSLQLLENNKNLQKEKGSGELTIILSSLFPFLISLLRNKHSTFGSQHYHPFFPVPRSF